MGNNVRFSGIVIGTVKTIEIVSDTSLSGGVENRRQSGPVLKQNDEASIGTDGLMGTKWSTLTRAG
ncbi:MAG: hypothetical protein IPJ06_07690 [Saprospiraceae bacterium]|nr:hypothetical protein [Saprospiraceae bacterium]